MGDFVILTNAGIKRLGRLFGKIKKYRAAWNPTGFEMRCMVKHPK